MSTIKNMARGLLLVPPTLAGIGLAWVYYVFLYPAGVQALPVIVIALALVWLATPPETRRD